MVKEMHWTRLSEEQFSWEIIYVEDGYSFSNFYNRSASVNQQSADSEVYWGRNKTLA